MSKCFRCNHGYDKRLSVNCILSRVHVTVLPSVDIFDGSAIYINDNYHAK